jgi:hypothetical protein
MSEQSGPQTAVPAGAVRPGEISILIATRGRIESLSEVLTSLRENTARKDKVALWFYVDDDDQVTLEAVRKGSLPEPGFPIHWHVGPRPGGLGETHQVLWQATGGTSQIYMTTVDDARFGTRGWDEIVRAKFDEYPDGVLLAFPHDPMTADQATYPILGWKWIRTIGKIYPGYFPYWGDDKWVDQVGRMAGRIDKLPISLDPVGGGKGRTKRMRNHPFWTRYFQLTLGERKESARKLIEAIHGDHGPGKAAALAKLEAEAQGFAREQEQFSDAYCVFQEERFTEMTPAERDQFDPKSFRALSAAVSRLITMAQAAMAQGRHGEAMEYLDATAYSDLRVRYAQMLKAECLRALGRPAEAGRLEGETLAAWPQMGLLRRTFRFLGMVANDGKRMLVGLSSKGKKA